MPLWITGVKIWDDLFKSQVNPLSAVVGLNVGKLNVTVNFEGVAARAAGIPDEIPIEVRAQEPTLRRDIMSSMKAPFKTTAKRDGSTNSYKVSVDPLDFRPLLKPGDTLLKVATVVREGGTSAVLFRSKLANGGWAVRGAAKQPGADKDVEAVTGDPKAEQPNAKTLFLAGGVEVLEVSVPASSGFPVSSKSKGWVFIRSPADVFFYSGHGSWSTCELLQDRGHDHYAGWLAPEKILPSWKEPVEILIINGCSVIGHKGMTGTELEPLAPCARRWRKLLKKEGGQLLAILGYRGTAPMDRMGGGQVGGDQIAAEMAQAMIDVLKNDWTLYARKWVEINARYPLTRTAAAMDDKGYWYINHEKEPRSHTHGERLLPGFDANLDEGAIMGPGAIPESWGG